MNKRAEIWMVFPPDQEYRYGEYPFNTREKAEDYFNRMRNLCRVYRRELKILCMQC